MALGLALARPAPSTIPLSDRDLVGRRNYSGVYLTDRERNLRYVARYTTRNGVRASTYALSGEGEGTESAVLNSALPQLELLIVDYYGATEIRYDSDLEFLIHRLIGYRRLVRLGDHFAQ